ALLRAFAERLADPEGEEDVLRLESDATLIKVVTIHKSKGLEYPLVLLPFIAGWREARKETGKAVGFHDEEVDAAVIELDGKDATATGRASEEQLAEDMRLLYVALTRARHGLRLGVAPLAAGNGKAVALDRGALGQALSPVQPLRTLADYRSALQALGAADEAIAVWPAPAPDAQRWQPPPATATAPARQPQRHGHAPWWIASYSALVQTLGAEEDGPAREDAATPEPEDAHQDQVLEGYESLSLAVTHHSDGWSFDPVGAGTIIGTGLVETVPTDPLPVQRLSSFGLRVTPVGLLVRDWETGKHSLCLDGQNQWKKLTSLDFIDKWPEGTLSPGVSMSVVKQVVNHFFPDNT
ncbi:MAG: hypothetical protein EOO29_55005, partial [Comamonadaceae bacterium]